MKARLTGFCSPSGSPLFSLDVVLVKGAFVDMMDDGRDDMRDEEMDDGFEEAHVEDRVIVELSSVR